MDLVMVFASKLRLPAGHLGHGGDGAIVAGLHVVTKQLVDEAERVLAQGQQLCGALHAVDHGVVRCRCQQDDLEAGRLGERHGKPTGAQKARLKEVEFRYVDGQDGEVCRCCLSVVKQPSFEKEQNSQ